MRYTADFETTTDKDDCRVWAWGLCEIEDGFTYCYGNSIDSLMYFLSLPKSTHTLYFHNLKFDGEFILHWLFQNGFTWIPDRKQQRDNTFTTLISDMGQWYSIEIFWNVESDPTHKTVTKIFDSLKILPFSVEAIAKGFGLPISKLKIDYKEYRPIGHDLTQEEIDYLRNDVEICARALYTLFNQGLNQMTQGSNALHDFKVMTGKKKFEKYFPVPKYDASVRKSYKGGFTYLNPKYKGKDIGEGIVLDVNSLYPSQMYYRPLPYGEPIWFDGEYQEDTLYNLYVQFVSCRFELKKDHIPTIQIKNSMDFMGNEYLTSSNGKTIDLVLTSVDLELMKQQYNLMNVSYHGGWKFKSTIGLFKDYIDKWTAVKIEAGKNGNKAMRTLAKLMLNALYGKFALNPKVASKMPYMQDSGIMGYTVLPQEDRDPVYIPVGTFITAWARYTTITSAQKLYDRFVYADTDSLHLIGLEDPKDLEIDDYKLGAWKKESIFKRARFLRQKSYIEDEYKLNDDGTIDYEADTHMKITCAGLPEKLHSQVTWDNFQYGMVYYGKLHFTHVKNGIVLDEIEFTIKK